jgi:hypothetical protein
MRRRSLERHRNGSRFGFAQHRRMTNLVPCDCQHTRVRWAAVLDREGVCSAKRGRIQFRHAASGHGAACATLHTGLISSTMRHAFENPALEASASTIRQAPGGAVSRTESGCESARRCSRTALSESGRQHVGGASAAWARKRRIRVGLLCAGAAVSENLFSPDGGEVRCARRHTMRSAHAHRAYVGTSTTPCRS